MTPASIKPFLEDAQILRSVLDSVAAGIAVCDEQGRLVCLNLEAERILAMGSYAVGPEGWSSLYGCYRPDGLTPFPPEQFPLVRALAGEEVQHELMFIRNPGQPDGVWISVSSKPLVDQAGAQRGAVAIFRDVTAAEKALRNHSPGLSQATGPATPNASDWQAALEGLELYRGHYERLFRAVEQTADSVFITDRQARIEYVNPAFEATSGYTAQEVLGRKPSLLQSGQHDKQFYEALWAKLDAGEPWRGTIVNRKKSGELYWSEQTISPMKDDAGRITHFVSVLKDITEQRKQREQEFHLQLASEVQQHLYRGADSAAGFDMAGSTCPADLTGGDYFDTIAHPDGCVTVAIGDVSGHGVGSALVMAATRAYVRAFTRSEADAASLLRNLNGALTADLNGGRFVTLMLIQVDPRTRSIEYAGAGHLPSYLLRGDGGVELVLGSTGPPLGLLAEAEFATCGPIAYGDGDTIVLFTDGITEAENVDGQEFGAERALDTVRLRRQSSAREVVEGLTEAVRAFCGEERQRDDITAVVCKLCPPA
jgi:sigma-B regulation protein RsbU (phosphoserine phosphatase)